MRLKLLRPPQSKTRLPKLLLSPQLFKSLKDKKYQFLKSKVLIALSRIHFRKVFKTKRFKKLLKRKRIRKTKRMKILKMMVNL
jgi:hypothetical protein